MLHNSRTGDNNDTSLRYFMFKFYNKILLFPTLIFYLDNFGREDSKTPHTTTTQF